MASANPRPPAVPDPEMSRSVFLSLLSCETRTAPMRNDGGRMIESLLSSLPASQPLSLPSPRLPTSQPPSLPTSQPPNLQLSTRTPPHLVTEGKTILRGPFKSRVFGEKGQHRRSILAGSGNCARDEFMHAQRAQNRRAEGLSADRTRFCSGTPSLRAQSGEAEWWWGS